MSMKSKKDLASKYYPNRPINLRVHSSLLVTLWCFTIIRSVPNHNGEIRFKCDTNTMLQIVISSNDKTNRMGVVPEIADR